MFHVGTAKVRADSLLLVASSTHVAACCMHVQLVSTIFIVIVTLLMEATGALKARPIRRHMAILTSTHVHRISLYVLMLKVMIP